MAETRHSQMNAATLGKQVTRREKTSFSLTPDAKYRLTSLKADLRRRGHPITESMILETLIERAHEDERLIDALVKAVSS